MPFGDNDWLALTQESTLEPEIPICDPHHHLWDMRPARIPYQRYLLDELYADLNSGHNVRSTVFIETRAMYRIDGPEEMRPVGEVEFVQGMAAAGATGLYGPARAAAAIVGHANLHLGDKAAPVLEALQAASPNRFRGVRHGLTWDPHPEIPNNAYNREAQLAEDGFRAGARVLLVDRDQANAETTLAAIKEEGGEASVFVGDVTNNSDCGDISKRERWKAKSSRTISSALSSWQAIWSC